MFAVYRMDQFLPLQKASVIKILINYLETEGIFSFEIKSRMSNNKYSWLLKKLTHSKITENSSVWMCLIILLKGIFSVALAHEISTKALVSDVKIKHSFWGAFCMHIVFVQ